MSTTIEATNICPRCGAALPFDGKTEGTNLRPDSPVVRPRPPEPGASALFASGSQDIYLGNPLDPMATVAEPDPILGEYVPPPSPAKSSATPPASSFGINLDGPPRATPGPGPAVEGFEEEHEPPSRGRSWSSLILGSYASAITLALIWTLYAPGRRDAAARPDADPGVGQADPGLKAALSRKVEPAGPIADALIVGPGKTLASGSLEVTPIDVKRQDVTLQRINIKGEPERRPGGKGALVLRLLLRNTSTDQVFAPLDPAYLRERGEGVVDSFVETAQGVRVYPFPLALESEWSIVGQDFDVLRPGESRQVTLATRPEAPRDDAGPFLWRVRLRTGIDRTGVIGVRWPEKPADPASKK